MTKLLNAENEIMESERKEQKKMSNSEELKAMVSTKKNATQRAMYSCNRMNECNRAKKIKIQ